jgi:hypothetical protein
MRRVDSDQRCGKCHQPVIVRVTALRRQERSCVVSACALKQSGRQKFSDVSAWRSPEQPGIFPAEPIILLAVDGAIDCLFADANKT